MGVWENAILIAVLVIGVMALSRGPRK